MDATTVWHRGVVAIGYKKAAGGAQLRGSGFIVDVPTGIICTCAHVIFDCAIPADALDPSIHGVAVGFSSVMCILLTHSPFACICCVHEYGRSLNCAFAGLRMSLRGCMKRMSSASATRQLPQVQSHSGKERTNLPALALDGL